MRHMPNHFAGEDGQSVEIPVARDWDALVLAFIGRSVSDAERAEIARMRRHNWTARVTAEAIIGRDLTADEISAGLPELRQN